MAYGAFRCLALPMGHPHMELVLRPFALLEPDIGDLPFVPGLHRPLEEPCQHACLSIHIAPPDGASCRGKSYRSEARTTSDAEVLPTINSGEPKMGRPRKLDALLRKPIAATTLNSRTGGSNDGTLRLCLVTSS